MNVRTGKYKRNHCGAHVEFAEQEDHFSFSGTLKIYANLWEAMIQVVSTQLSKSGEGLRWFPGR
jgi:hypothetical protein